MNHKRYKELIDRYLKIVEYHENLQKITDRRRCVDNRYIIV